MFKLCPCNPKVTKKGYWLCIVLFVLVLSIKGQAQNAASVIVLPDRPLTFVNALDLIGRQLGVHVDHEWDCPGLNDSCTVHGQMTFGDFFEPLKARGLTFKFVIDNYKKSKMLSIKRAPPAPAKPRIFWVWTQEAETGDPLPGVTVKNINTGETAGTDRSGMVCFGYTTFPVQLFLTYIGRQSLSVTILKDSTTIPLAIDAQSMEAVTVPYALGKRIGATGGYSTVLNYSRSYPYYHSTHRLSGVSISTVQTMLEGQVPGVLTTQSSGMPGSSSYVSVRGQASVVNGIDPFYVIDGVPSGANNASVSYIQPGNASKSLSSWTFIAPSDVERVDVLRDGDATAIYGSRGANGVFLITTRHWKAGLPKWDIEVSSGESMVIRQPSFMNISEYLAMRREALQNSGLTAKDSTAPDLTVLDTARNFDWRKWLLGRNARSANIKVAVSGGESKNNYTVGMDYLKEATPFPTQPDHDRFTTNFNYNHRSLDRRWTLQIAGLAGWDANHQFITYDPTLFRTLAPDAPPTLDQYGRLNFPPNIPYINPLSQIRQPYEALSGNYLVSLVSSYVLSDHLSVKTTAGDNHIQTREFGEMPLAAQDPSSGPTATGYFSSTSFDSHTFEPQLEYRRQDGKLLTTWLGGASFQSLGEHAAASTDTGYSSDIALLHHEHAIPIATSSQAARDIYTAFFTNLNANWNDKYVMNVTGRRDGSSRFPVDHRFANFGSIAFARIFSDANFIRRFLPFVSYGKIKVSEGVTGNNQIGDRTLQFVAGTSIQSFQSISGLYPSNPTSIGWEKTYKTELSLDLGFLQNRILFNATAYRHRSNNLLQTAGLSMTRFGSNNTSWPLVLENSGYELSLSATLADNNYFGWDIGVNWTLPRNKLVSFPELNKSIYATRLVVGQSINVLRGYVYKGVSSQSGLYSFADLNGDGKITDADQKVLGKFDVTGFGGFESTIRWRQFQFQMLIDARLATGVNYLAPIFANNPPGTINAGLSSNVPRVLLDHWREPGDRAAYQKLYAAPDVNADSTMRLYLSSSALLANTSFLRLRKVSLVYDLPAAKAMAMHLSSLAFFIDAQNLFIASPYKADPEIQSVLTMPTMRTIEIGVRLTH